MSHLWSSWLLLGLHVLAEKLESELAVVDDSTLVLVVRLEKSAKLRLWVVHACLFENSAKLVEIDISFIVCVEVLKHLDKAGLL